MIFLENEFLKIAIASKGAELKSVIDKKNNFEFLWQADPTIWRRTSPILFPVVGKPFNDQLFINGKLYEMPQHGFARDMDFELLERSESQLIFHLVSSDATFLKFPFRFELRLIYTLTKNTLECGYEVKNIGNERMCFSIGAHPAFSLPTYDLNDYNIEFEKIEHAERFLLTDGLLNNKTEPVFRKERLIELDKSLFDNDAIVFKDIQSNKIKLRSKRSSYEIEMRFKDFQYFGIWCKKNCEQFICLEPWCGIAGTNGEQIPIEQKEGINQLLPNEIFERSYSISFNS